MADSIRVLIVDDHPVVREGLSAMIEPQADLDVVGEAGDGQEAVELALRLRPNVVLMDLQMPRMNGVDAIREIRAKAPEIEVIVLTTYDSDEHIFRGIEAGARGYLLKGSTRDDLFKAIRSAARGQSLLEPVVASRLMARFSQLTRQVPSEEGLTEREMEVLKLMAEGMRNKEIARQLVVTEKTVKAHVSNILAKLGASDRTEAVTMAVRRGIIQL